MKLISLKIRDCAVLWGVIGSLFVSTAPVFAQTVVTTTSPQTTYYQDTAINMTTDRTHRNDFGLQVSGVFGTDNNVDDTFYAGAAWSHGLNPWLALGVEGGWQSSNFDVPPDDGDLQVVTVFGDIIGRINIPDLNAVPYGVIGLGALHAFTNTNSNDDDETAFAAKFGAGLDVFLTTNWILNVEAAYIATGANIDNGTASTTDLDHWRAGVGLKYAF